MADATSGIDYFTEQVIHDCLTAMGDEMFAVLRRTAHSPLIFETLDFAVGATDADGEVVAMGNGVTGFLGTLDAAVKDVLRKYARKDRPGGGIREGDIFMTNAPYRGGGSHLSDISLVMPVFDGEELIAFMVNKAHWTEVGGKDAGSISNDATEIYQEGLHFPNVRLCDQGRMNDALVEMIRANVRLPDMSVGDMWAGIAALRVGRRRFLALVSDYGGEVVRLAMARLLDYGERMVRQQLAVLPKGLFTATDWIDDDGLGNGPFEITCAVTISDDAFVADFTGSAPQVRGSINTTYPNLFSRVRAVYRAVTVPHIPTNGGMFRSLKVVCPPGTVFTAQHPAAVSTYYETALMAIELVWKALAPVLPDRLTAGNLGSVCGLMLSGRRPDSGEFWLMFTPSLGGWGAGADFDGQNGQFCAGNGQTFNLPAELTEARYGIAVERYALHDEAGGFGRFRGGKGVVTDYRILHDGTVMNCRFGRHRYPPWGVDGGHDGSTSHVTVVRSDGGEEVYGNAVRVRLNAGDLVRSVTATGAGYGDPMQRNNASVLADLRDGFVTREQAEEFHGVRIDDPDG